MRRSIGEWAISTNFTTTDDFLRKFGDAQKMVYSQGAGWMFWNWKVDSDAMVPKQKMWCGKSHCIWLEGHDALISLPFRSYRDALASGVLTPQPGHYFDVDVCAPYQ